LQIGTDMLFIINFCDLLLQHKIQGWTATKRLETDWQFAKRNCYRLSRVSWALAQISCMNSLAVANLSLTGCVFYEGLTSPGSETFVAPILWNIREWWIKKWHIQKIQDKLLNSHTSQKKRIWWTGEFWVVDNGSTEVTSSGRSFHVRVPRKMLHRQLAYWLYYDRYWQLFRHCT